MKQILFENINDHLKSAREEYDRLIADLTIVEAELQKGSEKAGAVSPSYISDIRDAIGIRKLG